MGALLWHDDRVTELEQAESAYMQSVALPIPGRYVPPYASVHLGESTLWGASTFEAERLYAEYGLEWQAGGTRARRHPPSHAAQNWQLKLAAYGIEEIEHETGAVQRRRA